MERGDGWSGGAGHRGKGAVLWWIEEMIGMKELVTGEEEVEEETRLVG
jgi:hypothetical protein